MACTRSTRQIAQYESNPGLARLLGLQGSCGIVALDSDPLLANACGDSTARDLPAYLPPQALTDRERRFPVVYFLPAYAAQARGVFAARPWEETFFQRVDRLIGSATIEPIIAVAVDGWTRLGGSQYVDSVHNGRYATWLTTSVPQGVDAVLPSMPVPQARALIGKSSGGFGALHIALTHPGVFGALAAHSPDSYFRYATLPAFAGSRREITACGSITAFVENFERTERASSAQFETMVTLAYAAAYSPRSTTAFDLELPFVLENGAIDDTVFARWLACDPAERVKDSDARAALAQLGLCYIDCGNRDEYGLDVGTRVFAEALRRYNVPHHYEEFSGGHRGGAGRYDRSLGALSTHFSAIQKKV